MDDVKSEFEYDKENRLIFYSSNSNPGVETTMIYNAFGQKKRETNPDSDTLFTWDGDDYYGFADAANDPENAIKIFIGDGGTMLGEFDPTDSKSRVDYMVDFLGSVTGSTDKNGGLLGSDRRYKPFGEVLSGDPVKPLNFAWTGNTGSMHTGLLYSEQYNRARHYSTTTNIWTTRDPLWPNEHAYGYVGGNPVTTIDPVGKGVTPPPGASTGVSQSLIAEIEEIYKLRGRTAAIAKLKQLGYSGSQIAIIIAGIVALIDLGRYLATGETGPFTSIGKEIGAELSPDEPCTLPLFMPSRVPKPRHRRYPKSCKEAGRLAHELCDDQGPRKPIQWHPKQDIEDYCWDVRARMSKSKDCWLARLLREKICGKIGPNGKIDQAHWDEIAAAYNAWIQGLDNFNSMKCWKYL